MLNPTYAQLRFNITFKKLNNVDPLTGTHLYELWNISIDPDITADERAEADNELTAELTKLGVTAADYEYYLWEC